MTTIQNAYDRFSTQRFALPSASRLDELERRIRVTFPEDYRRFLLQYNGGYFNEPEITPVNQGCPLVMLTCLYGIGASHPYAELAQPSDLVLFEGNDPPKILPIGDTPMNSLIILVTEPEGRGEIFLKEAFGDFHYLASSIDEFFTLLRQRDSE